MNNAIYKERFKVTISDTQESIKNSIKRYRKGDEVFIIAPSDFGMAISILWNEDEIFFGGFDEGKGYMITLPFDNKERISTALTLLVNYLNGLLIKLKADEKELFRSSLYDMGFANVIAWRDKDGQGFSTTFRFGDKEGIIKSINKFVGYLNERF